MRAATNPGGSGTNGRQGDFSNNFIRMSVGSPVEVLHYQDASLRKESLLRELVPAREAKAALRAQRQLEIVARHEARKQHDAQRRASRRAQAAEEERQAQDESALFLQKMWRGRGFVGAPARAESPKLSPEQAALLVQGRIRQHIASKAERTERALSRAACAIQSCSRRRSAILRVLNLVAYRKIDKAMAEVSLQLQPRLLGSAATTISRHARGRSARRLMHARKMLRLGGVLRYDVLLTRAALRIQTLYRGKLARRRTGSRRRGKPAGSRAAKQAPQSPANKQPGRRAGGSKDATPKGKDLPTDPSAAAAVPLPPPAAGTWQATPPTPRAATAAAAAAAAGVAAAAGAAASPRAGAGAAAAASAGAGAGAGAGAAASPRAGASSRPGAGAGAGAALPIPVPGAGRHAPVPRASDAPPRVPVTEPVRDMTRHVPGLAAHPRIGGTAPRGADGTPLEKLRRKSRELMADMRLSPERRKAAVEAAQR